MLAFMPLTNGSLKLTAASALKSMLTSADQALPSIAVRMLYPTVCPGVGAGVKVLPLTTEYWIAFPGAFVARMYVPTPSTVLHVSAPPETEMTGAA